VDEIMGRISKFSPDVQEPVVRLVGEQDREHGSQWAAICSVAVKIGGTHETLRRCVHHTEPS